jgi:hypothetical protein
LPEDSGYRDKHPESEYVSKQLADGEKGKVLKDSLDQQGIRLAVGYFCHRMASYRTRVLILKVRLADALIRRTYF